MEDRKLLMIVLGMLTLLFAFAFSDPSWGADPCPYSMGEVFYSANFSLSNRTPDTENQFTTQHLQIQLGVPAGSKRPGELIAQIKSGPSCQAVCHIKNFERDPFSAKPISVELSCQGSSFEALTTPATLIWNTSELGASSPVIRFGSWLNGFQQARLLVQIDRYLRPFRESKRIASRNDY